MAATDNIKRVGLIISSTRNPRVGPSIAKLVTSAVEADPALQTLPSSLLSGGEATAVTLEILDIAEFGLPLFDEPVMPMSVKAAEGYAHAHTRAWSRAVGRCDGFVFLTPQYNWSIPAALKNALDFLYHEWSGKPALVLSYGGRGGAKAAAHLRDILAGLRANALERSVAFPLSALGDDAMANAAGKGQLSDSAPDTWKPQLDEMRELVAELYKQL